VFNFAGLLLVHLAEFGSLLFEVAAALLLYEVSVASLLFEVAVVVIA